MSGLSMERREELAEELAAHREDATYPNTCLCQTEVPVDRDSDHYVVHVADFLAPLIEGWLAGERQSRQDYAAVSGYDLGYEDGAAEVRARVETVCDEAEKSADTYKHACIVTTGQIRAALNGGE